LVSADPEVEHPLSSLEARWGFPVPRINARRDWRHLVARHPTASLIADRLRRVMAVPFPGDGQNGDDADDCLAEVDAGHAELGGVPVILERFAAVVGHGLEDGPVTFCSETNQGATMLEHPSQPTRHPR
jgi:hypothetical protein